LFSSLKEFIETFQTCSFWQFAKLVFVWSLFGQKHLERFSKCFEIVLGKV